MRVSAIWICLHETAVGAWSWFPFVIWQQQWIEAIFGEEKVYNRFIFLRFWSGWACLWFDCALRASEKKGGDRVGGCASKSQVLLLLPFVDLSQLCQWVGSRLQWSARRQFFDCAHIVSPCYDCCIYCTVYGRHHPLLNHLNFISTQNRTAMSSSFSSLLFVLVVLLFCWCSVDQVAGQNNKKNGHKSSSSSSSALSSSNKLPPWHVRFARQQG